jgi:hypothetical protein
LGTCRNKTTFLFCLLSLLCRPWLPWACVIIQRRFSSISLHFFLRSNCTALCYLHNLCICWTWTIEHACSCHSVFYSILFQTFSTSPSVTSLQNTRWDNVWSFADCQFILYRFFNYRPPLWCSGQSFLLQIRRSQDWFPALPHFLRTGGLECGPLSLVRTIEELLEW